MRARTRHSIRSLEGIVQALLRNGGYVTVIVEAYFDESGSHDQAKTLCVAGYLFEKSKALKLSEEWDAVLARYGLPYFHMVDCAHGNGPFRALSKPQRTMAAAQMIGIIKRSGGMAFANSVDVDAYYEIPERFRPFGTPYSFCIRNVLDSIGGWFHQHQFKGRSAFFFEAGHKSRSEADRVIGDLFLNPLINLIYNHGYQGHSFVLKTAAPPVQAADILAWQWAQDVAKHQAGLRPRRKDFDSLMQGGFSGHHFSRERLPKYVEVLMRFGLGEDHSNDSLDQHYERTMKIHQEWRAVLARG